jgi:hypothetical protein
VLSSPGRARSKTCFWSIPWIQRTGESCSWCQPGRHLPIPRELVRKLEKRADLVIVDSVAALAVSDALPLLQEVSGSVVVVRMDRTSRASVRRLQKMIVSAQGTVLGAVATGTGTLARAYGGYVYGYDGQPGGLRGLLNTSRSANSNHASSSNGAVAAAEKGAQPAVDGVGEASGDPLARGDQRE